jgi:hypothetical protein
MPEKYFQKFPNIFYSNTLCKDITRRVKVVENEKVSPYIFYPFEIKHQLRSDTIAEYYYEDPELDWFIYHCNNIIDPYYQWYLDDYKMQSLMIDKYGSIETAQKRIKFYRNNWYTDDKRISVSFYNNNLANTHKQYYEPVYGVGLKVLEYQRKQELTVTNTNRILEYTITNNSSNAFEIGELVDIKATGTDTTIGTGEVVTSNSIMLRVQSVADNTHANSTILKDIVGETTGANATANDVTVLFENFTNSEGDFWTAVSFHDYEVECNEEKKNIRLISDDIHDLAVNEFTLRLQEDVDEETGLSL